MAFVRLVDGTCKTLSHTAGEALWRVINREVDTTPEMEAKAAKIKRLYLAWPDAPLSYKQAYPRVQPSETTQVPVRKDIDG